MFYHLIWMFDYGKNEATTIVNEERDVLHLIEVRKFTICVMRPVTEILMMPGWAILPSRFFSSITIASSVRTSLHQGLQ